jgi:hypothetical protein
MPGGVDSVRGDFTFEDFEGDAMLREVMRSDRVRTDDDTVDCQQLSRRRDATCI